MFDKTDKTDQSFNSSTLVLNRDKRNELNKKLIDEKINFINNDFIRDILKQNFISDQEFKKTLKQNEKFIMAFETLSNMVIDYKSKYENLEKDIRKLIKSNHYLKSEILIFSKNLIESNKKNDKLKKEISEIKLGNLSNSAIDELRSPVNELNTELIDVNHLKFINDNAKEENLKNSNSIIQSQETDNCCSINNENLKNIDKKKDP
jgi:hypothetical protein